MSWFSSDDLPQIPADILSKLGSGVDHGDCGDVSDAEHDRSSVRRLVAIIQKLNWRVVELQSDLITEKTNNDYMREQIKELVKTSRRLGCLPSRKPPNGQ